MLFHASHEFVDDAACRTSRERLGGASGGIGRGAYLLFPRRMRRGFPGDDRANSVTIQRRRCERAEPLNAWRSKEVINFYRVLLDVDF